MTREEQLASNRARMDKETSIVAQVVDKLMDRMNLAACVYYDKCRDNDHCDVRRVVQHTLHHHFKFGLSQIARNAKLTHASVLHNVNQCDFLIRNKDKKTIDLIKRMRLEEDECEGVL